MARKTKQQNGPIVAVEGDDPIYVTPDHPLTVTTTPVSYASVIIQGGDINVNNGSNVTFEHLTKES